MWYKVNKRYVGTQQVRPSGWKPWSNTIAYYPLETDANDASWNWHNASWVSGSSYTTVSWKLSANFDWNRYINTWVSVWSWPLTIACLFCHTDLSWSTYQTAISTPFNWNWSSNAHIWMCFENARFYRWAGHFYESWWSWPSLTLSQWYFWAIRIDSSWNVKLDLDTATVTGTTSSFNITDNVYIWAWIWNRFKWNIKNVLICNDSISDAELELFRKTITA